TYALPTTVSELPSVLQPPASRVSTTRSLIMTAPFRPRPAASSATPPARRTVDRTGAGRPRAREGGRTARPAAEGAFGRRVAATLRAAGRSTGADVAGQVELADEGVEAGGEAGVGGGVGDEGDFDLLRFRFGRRHLGERLQAEGVQVGAVEAG